MIQIYFVMDLKSAQADIKKYRIRQGPLYKRSKFLKQWRERWVVLTNNFMYTFANKKMQELTDAIDLKQIKSYKSYLRKVQEIIPPGFKIRSADDMYYFCAKNCNEKWSWIVSLERLMDFKYVGPSHYNSMDDVKLKGFDSQVQFEAGGAKMQAVEPPLQKLQTKEEAKKTIDDEADKIMKQLKEQQEELNKQKLELEKKEAEFIREQKKEEEKKQKEQPMPQTMAEKPKTEPEKQPPPPQPAPKDEEVTGSVVSQLRNMYESKAKQNKSNIPKYDIEKHENKEVKEKKHEYLPVLRSQIIKSLFEEFRREASELFGIKYIIDFIVNISADQNMGYSPYVIIEGKSHPNRQIFSDIFIELLSVYEDYEHCDNLMKFIETCVFQMPGLFDSQQTAHIQKKLEKIFSVVTDEAKLALIIKNMFIMHKLCRYERNAIYTKLDKLVKEVKNEETRNWAKKLRDDL